ncbi:MAG: zinc ribbon domain-containing protein [Bacilli bacterium]|nr:zinc ribbon domain-containing protein [Bacilli bacterium]
MKCPSCGNEVTENNNYCNKCGSSLYGPRSINLNDIGQGVNIAQSNNIQSITGIDINDLAPGPQGTVQSNDFSPNKNEKKKRIKEKRDKEPIKINLGTLIMVIVIVVLLGLSLVLYSQNNKLKVAGSKPCETIPTCGEEGECIQGIYGITSAYTFVMPSDWIYTQTANEAVLTNGTISILLFNTKNGLVDKVTSEALKNEYVNQGYVDATVVEDALNSKKIIYVSFASENMKFVDFYYQYNAEKVIYGQVSATEGELLTDDVKDIIASAAIQTNSNNITVGKANVNYENIFSILN